MPLYLTVKKPAVRLDMDLNDYSLTEITGTARWKGDDYRIRVSRNSTGPEDNYGIVEIQQMGHSADQETEIELYGDGYTYPAVPLPEPLRALDGDVIDLGAAGTAALTSRMVQPWVYPDSDGNYSPTPPYTLQALQAKLTVEQADVLFAQGGIASWADTLAEQQNR